MSEALYRKYRPQTFEDVVGQTHIERTLKNAIEQDKVGHAYLFCGPRGTGKTTTARLLAKALLCEKGPTPAPDGSCEQCEAIAAGIHPDVYELDAASRTGVDNVREEIIGRVQYAPTRGRYKVYIIDEVHMLSIAAFNALLKTLEEPPSHVVFIMCTTDPQKVPETIQSRCQRFDFHRLSKEEIISRLGAVCTAEGVNFEGDALDLVAHRAQGGMRDALTMLEQLIAFGDGEVTVEVANDVLGSLDVDDMADIVRHIAQRDAAACFTWVSEYVETGADLAHFVRDLATYVRDLYVLTLTDGAVAVNAPQSALARMAGEARMFGVDRLAYILRVLGDLNTELRTSTNPRLSFEIGLTRMVRPQSDLTLESLAARVEVLERALAQGDFASRSDSSASQPASPGSRAHASAAIPASANSGYRALQGQASQGQPAAVQPKPNAEVVAPGRNASRTSDRAAEFRAQLEQRHAQRSSAQAASFAPSPQAAPASTAAVASSQDSPSRCAAPAAQGSGSRPISDDVKAKISNPAALQRGWQTALADLKRQRAAYGALLLSARFVAAPDASGVFIEFSPENSFAYSAAQKPDISAALEQALSSAFGGFVPFCITQGNSAAATFSSAPAPAPAPAPTNSTPSRAAAQDAQAQRSAAQASSEQRPQQAPPWEDDVVPYTDADIAAYVSQDEPRPFSDPDASQSAGAPSHREMAPQTSDAPAGGASALNGDGPEEMGLSPVSDRASSGARSNPFANRKMPEGIGKRPSAALESLPNSQAASSESGRAGAKAKAPTKEKASKADEVAAAVAQFGDAMLVVGPTPVDPYPAAIEMGFDSAFDPKLKAKNLAKPKGWPMPGDARLVESSGAEKASAAGDSNDDVAMGLAAEPRDFAVPQEPAAHPEPSAPVDSEPVSPNPIPSAFARPNPFANRAMPKAAGDSPSSPEDGISPASDGSGELSAEEIFKAFGVRPSEIVEQR